MPHVDTWRNGVKLVSVTELQKIIAKPFLDNWRLKLCQCKTHEFSKKSAFKPAEVAALDKFGKGHCGFVYADNVRDDAGDLGNEVHEIIEAYFKGLTLEHLTGEATEWATKIVSVYEEHKVTPAVIKPEENLIDKESGLAGSPDTIGYWDGRIEILDTKIKNSLDDLTALQGVGYRYLLRRLHNVDVRYMRPVWCDKSTVGKLVKTDLVYDLDEWMEPWKALVTLWNVLNPKRNVNLQKGSL